MKKIFLLAAVALGLVSCDLTTPPEIYLDSDKALSVYSGIDGAAAVTYSAFRSEGWYGLNTLLYPDVMCGNCVAGIPLNTGRGMNWQTWNFTEAGGGPVFGSAYTNILRCNNVIYAIKNNAENYLKEDGVKQQDLDNLMAECLFVRALCYFDLVRWYAQPYAVAVAAPEGDVKSLGVPVTSEDANVSVLQKPARETTVKNYELIVEDLTTALEIIDPEYVRAGVYDTKCAVSVGAIEALLARVYLYMNDYANAELHATNVINSGDYQIADAATYQTFWGDVTWEGAGEIIFAAYVSQVEGYLNSSPGGLTHPDEYGDIRVSNDLLELYADGDVRKEMLRTSDEHTGYYWPNKYQGKDGGPVAYSSIPMIRISEMYLVRAEARYEQGNINGATSDINVIASNRNAAEFAVVSADDIFNERRRELAFEGHLFHDYKRLQRDLVRTDVSSAINKDVPATSKYWCMPFVESEFDVNPNLVQNPGW
ncbi:MAG: RagB/SusD family nutrient uptake outer membrane protein [Bacteroidales bacterium]|nr:RagB/SusD family nutrient uptake outer membrane protein [Bacteroidales bacterium]